MKLLNLNCQKGINPNFQAFFKRTLGDGKHKILLLQEATDAIVEMVKDAGKTYKVIRPKTPSGTSSEVCILHTQDTKCIDTYYSHMEDENGHFFGVLMGAFKTKRSKIVAASVHLPAYLQPKKRYAAIKKVREAFTLFLKKHPETQSAILAGDFNSIFPWEHERNKTILKSILLPLRNKRGYTHHTQRLEPDGISSILVNILSWIGFTFKTSLDHVFASHVLVRKRKVKVYVLEKNVSDHLPILIEVR
jgi:endonuclease/exonuclease/phosphatase family metal-dependent hydrolase